VLVVFEGFFSNCLYGSRSGLHLVLPIVLGLPPFEHIDQDSSWRNIRIDPCLWMPFRRRTGTGCEQENQSEG
jgi:hypothetical protein